MISDKQITEFLYKTIKDSWANPNIIEERPFPGLKLIKSKKDELWYIDQYVGGEPFQGFEVIWHKELPVWSMCYRGLYSGKEPYEKFIAFLKAALRDGPEKMPVRGPKEFKSEEFPYWKYKNEWKGKIEEFEGRELIFFKGKEVYWTEYQGGRVNSNFNNL